jgi:microcystin-dependent protein
MGDVQRAAAADQPEPGALLAAGHDVRRRRPRELRAARPALTLGAAGGEQAHTLTGAETPTHAHGLNASTTASGGTDNPTGNFLGSAGNLYHAPANVTTMNPGTIANTGGSQPHLNMQPFLTLTFGIALQGIFPSPN